MNSYAIITVYHTSGVFTSLPMEMADGASETQLILKLSEEGTDGLNMLKFPTSEASFVIFSKSQLEESVVEIEVLDPEPVKPAKKKASKKGASFDNDEMIKS